eukprot:scaffold22385_cov71-Phaeocystis_antarctica.AAC.1
MAFGRGTELCGCNRLGGANETTNAQQHASQRNSDRSTHFMTDACTPLYRRTSCCTGALSSSARIANCSRKRALSVSTCSGGRDFLGPRLVSSAQ